MTPENIAKIVADKDYALENAEKLYEKVLVRTDALTDKAYAKFVEHFTFMRMYVRALRLSARGYCFGRYVEDNGADAPLLDSTAGKLLEGVIADLKQYYEDLLPCAFLEKYPYDAQLNPERVVYFTRDLERILAGK